MWGNLILAFSNLYGLIGVIACLSRGMTTYAILITLSILSAVVAHLAESGPSGHNMSGIGWKVSPDVQKQLMLAATAFTLMEVLYTFFVITWGDIYLFVVLFVGVVFLLIPELVSKSASGSTIIYEVLHTISHILTRYVPNKVALDMKV